jgi:hypothetical protein
MNMKTIFLAGSLVFAFNAASGQARETTITIGKEKVNAVKVEVNAPVKEVQSALAQQFTSASKPKRGPYKSLTYSDVVVPSISTDTVDVWTRVQKNGNNSIIYLAVKDPQGNYLSGETDSASVDKIKDFLYDFARAQNYSSNDLEIGALIDSVQTDQTAFEQYTSERTKIETQIKELQSQLQAMEQKHTASRQEMDRRRQRLEQLTATSEGNVRTEKSAKDNKNNNDDNNRQDQKK